jgi:hypothetical protein
MAVLSTEIAPITVLIPEQELWWHVFSCEQGAPRAWGHQDLTELEFSRLGQLVEEEFDAGLGDGEGARRGIGFPALPGAVLGAQQVPVVGERRLVLVFDCRHRRASL